MVVCLIHRSEVFQHTRLVQICVALEVFLIANQLHNLNIRIQISRLTFGWFILISALRCVDNFIRSRAGDLIYILRLGTFIVILAIFVVQSLFKRCRMATLWSWVLKCVLHSNNWSYLFLVLNPKVMRTQGAYTLRLNMRELLIIFQRRESAFWGWHSTFLLDDDAYRVVL